MARATCEIDGMARRDVARSVKLVGMARSASGALRRTELHWVLVALAVSFSMSLACRSHDAPTGAGGQSGDEGCRAVAPWLGTGGVASEPALR